MPSLDVQPTSAPETAEEAQRREMTEASAAARVAVEAALLRRPEAQAFRAIIAGRAVRLWVCLVLDRERWRRYNARWFECLAIRLAAEAANLERVVAAVVTSVLEDAAAGRRELAHPGSP